MEMVKSKISKEYGSSVDESILFIS
jgi:hypothetical protein